MTEPLIQLITEYGDAVAACAKKGYEEIGDAHNDKPEVKRLYAVMDSIKRRLDEIKLAVDSGSPAFKLITGTSTKKDQKVRPGKAKREKMKQTIARGNDDMDNVPYE